MRTLVVGLLAIASSAVAIPPPPSNDECSQATVAPSLPFYDSIDTTGARPQPGEPPQCVGGGPTVWYVFTPPADGSYCAKTCGSDYDTVLSNHPGSCTASEDDCDDDGCYLQSRIFFAGTAGVPMYIQVGMYDGASPPAPGSRLEISIADGSADTDGDGVSDCADDCAVTFDPLDGDSDFDGVGDVCDPCAGPGGHDDDGDLVCAQNDNCPLTPNPGQADADGDRAGDACDQCAFPGEIDDDGDGYCEDRQDNCPYLNTTDQTDSDQDFSGDACDRCPGQYGDGTIDTDGDDRPDVCDACPNDPNDECATIWGCLGDPHDWQTPSYLARIDPGSGRGTVVGALGTGGCRGLAFEPGTGRLLAFAASLVNPGNFDLYSVDTATAAITRIGETAGSEGASASGMSFRADGTLFAVIDGMLVTIDPQTGAATTIDYVGSGLYVAGTAFDAADRLIAANYGYTFEIHQITGATTELAELQPFPECPNYAFQDTYGLARGGSTLFHAFVCENDQAMLGTLDPDTGVITFIGRPPLGLGAMAIQTCGNGTAEGTEECDDGNLVAGDCCSPSCEADAPGSPCTDDGSSCTTDTCDDAATCVHTVPAAAGCGVAPSRRAAITIKPGADPKVTWRWRGSVADPMDYGPPTSTTDLTLCVGTAGGSLAMTATAPRGGICQGAPCWRPKPTGYDYLDKDRTPDGVEKMTLRGSATPGKARIKAKGRGPNLPLVAPPYTAPVLVRLIREDGGGCWEATYSAPSRNDAAGFRAKSD